MASPALKEKSLSMEHINPVKGLEFLGTVCGSVAKSGALAKALCALDHSKIGMKLAFTYSQTFQRGPVPTGILVPTIIGWLAIDLVGNVLGVATKWSDTELYNNDEFLDQFKRVLLAGLPAITYAKLLDMAVSDNAKATKYWQNIRASVEEGLDALRPE